MRKLTQFKALHKSKSHCCCDNAHDRPESRLPRSSPPFRCQHKNARNLKCRNHLQQGRSEDECDVEFRERIIPYTKAINMRLMAHSSFRSRLKCHVYGISISCEANFPRSFLVQYWFTLLEAAMRPRGVRQDCNESSVRWLCSKSSREARRKFSIIFSLPLLPGLGKKLSGRFNRITFFSSVFLSPFLWRAALLRLVTRDCWCAKNCWSATRSSAHFIREII